MSATTKPEKTDRMAKARAALSAKREGRGSLKVLKGHEFKAFAVVRKPGAGNLCVLRKMTIKNGVIVSAEDDVEDLFLIKMARLQGEVETLFQ